MNTVIIIYIQYNSNKDRERDTSRAPQAKRYITKKRLSIIILSLFLYPNIIIP